MDADRFVGHLIAHPRYKAALYDYKHHLVETLIDPRCTVVPQVELDVDNIEVIRLRQLADRDR